MREISYKSPLYIQLREVIRSKIEEEEYLPGTAIPSENQLMETYGLNRVSVRSALAALEFEGLLKSVQGKPVKFSPLLPSRIWISPARSPPVPRLILG